MHQSHQVWRLFVHARCGEQAVPKVFDVWQAVARKIRVLTLALESVTTCLRFFAMGFSGTPYMQSENVMNAM